MILCLCGRTAGTTPLTEASHVTRPNYIIIITSCDEFESAANAAAFKTDDGIVTTQYNKCLGNTCRTSSSHRYTIPSRVVVAATRLLFREIHVRVITH